MIALSALLMLSSVLQTRWALPVSIRALAHRRADSG